MRRYLHRGEIDVDKGAAVALGGVCTPRRGELAHHEARRLDIGHARAQALSAEEAASGKAEVLQIAQKHEDVEAAHRRSQQPERVAVRTLVRGAELAMEENRCSSDLCSHRGADGSPFDTVV